MPERALAAIEYAFGYHPSGDHRLLMEDEDAEETGDKAGNEVPEVSIGCRVSGRGHAFCLPVLSATELVTDTGLNVRSHNAVCRSPSQAYTLCPAPSTVAQLSAWCQESFTEYVEMPGALLRVQQSVHSLRH